MSVLVGALALIALGAVIIAGCAILAIIGPVPDGDDDLGAW